MRELIVNENDSGQRVDKFLSKTLHELPPSLMYKYIRNKKIKVNKQRCTISQKLVKGDVLQCYIAEEFFDKPVDFGFLQAKGTLTIVYEDEQLLIVNKPAGLLVHSDQKDDYDTLVDQVKAYLYHKLEYNPLQENSFTPALANRLDRNTSGLVIAAKTAIAMREINRLIKERKIDKRYLCIVEGKLAKTQDSLCFYHQKQADNHAAISKVEKAGYKEVRMDYCVLNQMKSYAFVEVNLHTGKSHQIRACFSAMGHPLLGDKKYGGNTTDWKHQALCAYSLCFHPDESYELNPKLFAKTVLLKEDPITSYIFKKR